MKRREFIMLLGGAAAAWPLAARAQRPEMRRLGVLMNGSEGDPIMKGYLAAFEQPLRPLGWTEQQNIHIDRRWTAGDPERTRLYAPELVALAPDAILSLSSANLKALQRETRSIPIVFALVSDPVAQGFVMSLAHPEGNITGFSAYEFSIGGKWVDMLKQLSPGLAQVGLLFNPDVSIQSKEFMRSIEATAPSFGVNAAALPVRSSEELESTIAAAARQSNGGLIVPTDQFLSVRRKLLIDLVAKHRIPTIYAQPDYVSDGGLISYGTDQAEQLRKAAIYVDRILRGAKRRSTHSEPYEIQVRDQSEDRRHNGYGRAAGSSAERRRGDRIAALLCCGAYVASWHGAAEPECPLSRQVLEGKRT